MFLFTNLTEYITMAHVEHGPRSENKMTYDEAIMYCFWFTYNGKKGWRLPTFHEFLDGNSWYKDAEITKRKWYVKPVRDIK
jgi:hypothetical protein